MSKEARGSFWKWTVALVVGMVSLASSSALFADFELGKWAFVKQIVLPEGVDKGTLVEVVPDRAVYSGAASNLRDLRIISGSGEEVAYVSEIAQGSRQTSALAARVLDNGYVEGEYNTFVVDLGSEGVLHNRIEILTSSENFKRDVVVESSADKDTWAEITAYSIYDFTLRERGANSRDTRVNYPDNTNRYLRVRVLDDGEGALTVTGARVLLSEDVEPSENSWSSVIVETFEDTDAQTSAITFDLGSHGLPSHRLTLDVGGVNFYRLTTLEQSDDLETWQRVASVSAIYLYETPKFVGGSLEVPYSESNARYFRLTVHNEDNPPVLVKGASFDGFVRRVVFIADPAKTYELYYGNSTARRPSYDLNQIYPYLDGERRAIATLGTQAMTEEVVVLEPVIPVSEGLPWLLPTVIAGAAVVVGVILYGVFRQVKGLLPPPPE